MMSGSSLPDAVQHASPILFPTSSSPLQREARAAERQRLQGQDELALLPALEEEEQAEQEEGAAPRDQAVRELVQKLRQWPPEEQEQQQGAEEAGEAGGAAAGGAPAAPAVRDAEPAGEAGDKEEEGLPPIDVVEADYIFEEQPGQGGRTAPPGMPPPAPSRCACGAGGWLDSLAGVASPAWPAGATCWCKAYMAWTRLGFGTPLLAGPVRQSAAAVD